MFKPIQRANRSRKFWMRNRAEEIAEENDWTFTGDIEATKYAAYTAEFTSEDGKDSEEPFYGWAIAATDGSDDIEFVFGAGQMVFDDYEITEEDYYETIGAGI